MDTNSGMTSDQLVVAGRALYGERWQTSLATDLRVADRTMRRWLTGETSIPGGLKNELRELLISRVNEIDGIIRYSFNQSPRSEYFSREALKQFDEQRSELADKCRQLMARFVSRNYRNPQAREHAPQGFLRRIESLVRCIDNVFQMLPPDLAGLPTREALLDATINLQSFIFNVFGSLDNLARIWVNETGRTKKDGSEIPDTWIGLGKGNTLVRGSFTTGFQKQLTGLNDWFDYLEGFRHALAHRIPLYIPPYVISPEKDAAYRSLENRRMTESDITEYERLSTEQKALATFVPVMMHSFEEKAKPVAFHSQMLIDFLTIEELAEEILGELGP
jgi:hypothetical protein